MTLYNSLTTRIYNKYSQHTKEVMAALSTVTEPSTLVTDTETKDVKKKVLIQNPHDGQWEVTLMPPQTHGNTTPGV